MITETFHPEYIAMLGRWQKCRICDAGEEAVHLAGDIYLPRLGDQSELDYEAYKKRARFFNAFAKTISGHTGLVLRTPVNVETPDSFEELEANIDKSGASIADYIKVVLEQVLTVGRHGTLIDYSQVQEGATKQDAKNTRPYWISYKTEDILDWEYTDGVLSYVLLREAISKKDDFYTSTKEITRYRVLKLEDGIYSQQVYIHNDTDGDVAIGDAIVPTMNNAVMDFIPFIIHQTDFDIHVNKPPLLDLVNTNLSHYRVSADYYHGLHFVALPTPYITGIDPDDEAAPSSIGPQKLWLISNESASVGLLEFTGAGLEAIKFALDDLKDDMALLGARMLLTETSEKTATAAKIKSISETSDLSASVSVLNTQFNWMVDITIQWASMTGDSSITISRNFIPPELDAQMLLALVKSWQDGAYDYETLVLNLQRGEVVDPNVDLNALQASVDKELDDRMEAEATAMAAMAPTEPVANGA